MTTDEGPLGALLRQVAGDERFVGWALACIGPADPAALAARLGCPPQSLTRLALCLRPDDGSERFAGDVRAIAAYAGCDPVALRDLLREVSAVRRLRAPAGADAADVGRGLLLAARDRPRQAETPGPKPEVSDV